MSSFISRYPRSSITLQAPVHTVCVVGGTHGNELNGVVLSREFAGAACSGMFLEKFPTLSISTLLGNPAAIAAIGTGAGRRYVDVDLNRCFSLTDLADHSKTQIEYTRAREIDQILGPKASERPKTDYIIDIHSTTSNTGVLICCHPRDLYTQKIAAILQSRYLNINVVFWPDKDVSLLPSISLSGMTLEIGPISHSTCDSALLQKTKRIIFDIFEIMNGMNSAGNYESNFEQARSAVAASAVSALYPPMSLRYNERYATIGYPRGKGGELIGLVHPKWQRVEEMADMKTLGMRSEECSNSFGSIDSGSIPLFQRIDDGSDICVDFRTNSQEAGYSFKVYMGDNYANFDTVRSTNYTLYPLFVNEAAYMESDVAMILTVGLEKRSI